MGGTIECAKRIRNLRPDGNPVQGSGGSWSGLDIHRLSLIAGPANRAALLFTNTKEGLSDV